MKVFKSLPAIHATSRRDALSEAVRRYASDTITLGWEERLSARGRRRSDRGVEFGTSLPRGTVLRAGDCFLLEEHALVIEVVERLEPVLVVEPGEPREWGLFAYYIGNCHQPVMITDRTMVCPDVPGMAQVLEQHGIPFSRGTKPFTPVGMFGDVYTAGHQHVTR